MNYKNVNIIILSLMFAVSCCALKADATSSSAVEKTSQSRAQKRRLRRQQNSVANNQTQTPTTESPTTGKNRRRERLRQRRRKSATSATETTQSPNENIVPTSLPPVITNQQESSSSNFSENSLPIESSLANLDQSFKESETEYYLNKIKAPISDERTEDDLIEFQFQDADLSNLLIQVESIFNCSFITDEAIDTNTGPASKTKLIKGNKITYRTTKPITKKEAWSLFLTFLDVYGFNIVPQSDPTVFRIQPYESARSAPLPTFIDTDFTKLPDNDAMIRYLYFIKNSSLENLEPIVKSLASTISKIIPLKENKAFIIIDKGFNIKMMMKIVSEFDKACSPQSWSFLRLKYADADYVSNLYKSLAATPENQTPPPLFGARRPATTSYFSDNTRVVSEPRTNSLILLGTPESIKKLERFIVKHIDVQPEQVYSPLNVYRLKYADADTIVSIMNTVSTFGKGAPTDGTSRSEQRYNRPISFIAEKTTNSIIIKGDHDSYLMAKSIIDQLDSVQPQVAIDMLIISVNHDEKKELGAQIRSKATPDCASGGNVKFQTSGLAQQGGIVQNTTTNLGVERLLGNLLNLVTQSAPGNTVLTLGKDIFGVWGIFQALQTVSNSEVISNPFLITTNRKKASVSLGETRRVVSSQIIQNQTMATNTEQDLPANLTIEITPQINADGMVVLKIDILFNQFTNPASETNISSGNQITRRITTMATVADQEVIALGGFIRNRTTQGLSKVPILGDIPLAGWLFKNESKEEIKDNLLILISSRIIEPEEAEDIKQFTDERIAAYQSALTEMANQNGTRDPIQRLFFDRNVIQQESDRFIFERNKSLSYESIDTVDTAASTKKDIVDKETPLSTPAIVTTKSFATAIPAPSPSKEPSAVQSDHKPSSLKQRRPQFSLTGHLRTPPPNKEEIKC